MAEPIAGQIVDALRESLASRNREVRDAAVTGLLGCRADPELVAALFAALSKGTKDAAATICSLDGIDAATIRRCWFRMIPSEAANVFLRFGDPSWIDALLKQAASGDTWSITVLGDLREGRALPVLTNLLRTRPEPLARIRDWLVGDSATVSRRAAESLGLIGDPSSIQELERVSLDATRNVELRTTCIEALGAFHTAQAKILIRIWRQISALKGSLAAACLNALGATGRAEAVPVLSSAVEGELANDAVEALAMIGGDDAVRSISRVLHASTSDILCETCLDALGKMTDNDSHALDITISVLCDRQRPNRIRIKAANVLGASDNPVAMSALAKVIGDETTDGHLSTACIGALGRSKAEGAIRTLAESIEHRVSEAKVRWACEQVMTRLENPADAELLAEVLRTARSVPLGPKHTDRPSTPAADRATGAR